MSQAHVNTHALERSIRHLGSGPLALEQLRAGQSYDQLGEIECQVQIPIWGVAASGVGWSKFSVQFDVEFIYASNQRDSVLTMPHFSYGAVVSGHPSPDGSAADPNNPDSLVAISCQVVQFGTDQAINAIIGAIVGVGVSTIGGQDVRFDGYLHLTFQGYGAPSEATSSAGGFS